MHDPYLEGPTRMPIKKLFLYCSAVFLLTALIGCEKAEEELTPPAVLEKPAPRTETSKAPQAAKTDDANDLADWTYEDPESGGEVPLVEAVTDESAGDAETEETEKAPESFAETEIQPVALFPPEMLERDAAHICFFSFNTSSEYVQLKRMVTQLNEASNAELSVTEYQMLDSDPYDSFVNLLKTGKQCDGVVLSGHHTDEFYGERSDGDLEIEDLEELACEPRHEKWFSNIKALWLQGCNTVKAGVNNTDLDEDELITGSPIQHMQRLLDPSDMEESVDDIRDLLYENTNEENLVNDYMRVFSGATVYGWSFKAPGEQAGAQKSIPYHLAQVTRLVENDKQYFVNPLQTRIPQPAAERYSQVLYGLLKRPNRPEGTFPEKLSEKTFMQAWRDHGNYRYQYAFDNHDIEAFPALGNSNNEILKQLKGLTCLMHQLDDELEDMGILEVADYILRDRTLTTYNTYLLWAMLRSLPRDSEDYNTLRQRMVSDDHLVRELRFNTALGGYSKTDAEEFLAALDPPPVVAKPVPASIPEASPTADRVAEPEDTQSPAPTQNGNQENPVTKAALATPDAIDASSDPQKGSPTSGQAESEPWYMNEGMGGTEAEEEQVFEFKNDSPG